MSVLVTGGAGYIGSHAVRQLLLAGRRVVVVDNLSRGHSQAVSPEADFIQADVADEELMVRILVEHAVDCVMHFAALTCVGESVALPAVYYETNVCGTMHLLNAMKRAGVTRMVFSSTCATYGMPDELPITESTLQRPINPYGRSKLWVEQMLEDRTAANGTFSFAALRYFNAAGCSRDGSLGEDHDPETHLIPIALQAALGLRERVVIFGSDYDTPDGTCIRDYIQVDDLCTAHLKAMDTLQPGDARFYNLGIGRGHSVREVIDSVRRVTGRDFAVEQGERRPGDAPVLFASAEKAFRDLSWRPEVTQLDEIVATAWRWFQKHPRGYRGSRGG